MGSRRAWAGVPPRSPRRGAFLKLQRRGWQRYAEVASSGDPRSVCLRSAQMAGAAEASRNLRHCCISPTLDRHPPSPPSSWSEAHLGSGHPAPRGAMRGGLGSLWQGRRSLLGGSVTRAGLIIHTFEGSGEPRTCFPLVFWRITKALGPAGQVACSSQEACALLGRWTRRPCRLRPELGPPALRRPEPAPRPLRVHLRAQGSLPACALFYLRAQCSASPLRRRLL